MTTKKTRTISPDELEACVVTRVREATAEEVEALGWDDYGKGLRPLAMVLDDEYVVFASRDPEGNGPGAFHVFGDRAFGCW